MGQARSSTPSPIAHGWAGGLFALRVTRRGQRLAGRVSGLKQQSRRAAKQQAAKQESRKAEHQSSTEAEQSCRAGEQQSRKAPTNNTNTNPLNQPQTTKRTATNREKTCEETNKYQQRFKKTIEISKNKKLPPKTKKLQKILKMEPEGLKMQPGCTKSGAKIEKHALNYTKWLPDDSQDPFTGKGS